MQKLSRHVGVALLLSASACSGQQEIDKVTVGQDVAVVKADGGVVEGKVTSLDETTVQVATGPTTRSIPKKEVVDVEVVDPARPAPLPPAAKFREYTVAEGTTLSLRLATALDSGAAAVGNPVEAALAEAVLVGGAEVLPAGSPVKGRVAAVQASGKVKGLASITVHFTSVAAAGRDDRYDIDATYAETARATKAEDATKIGIGAGAGAAVGGLLGGKSGAAKGAVIGGGAGTAVVLATEGKQVEHPIGARLSIRLKKSIDVRVPIG